MLLVFSIKYGKYLLFSEVGNSNCCNSNVNFEIAVILLFWKTNFRRNAEHSPLMLSPTKYIFSRRNFDTFKINIREHIPAGDMNMYLVAIFKSYLKYVCVIAWDLQYVEYKQQNWLK
jgi:hypothetical protein